MRTNRFRSADGTWLDVGALWRAIEALAWIVIAQPDPEQRERMLDTYSLPTRCMVQSVIRVEVDKVLDQMAGKWS